MKQNNIAKWRLFICCLKIQQRNFASRKAAVDQLLRSNERTITFSDDNQPIEKIEVSQLAANKPVEDFYSASKCLVSGAYLFGVFDGHAGTACARHVCTRLYDYICSSVLDKHRLFDIPIVEQLLWLFASAEHKLLNDINEAHQRNIFEYYNKFRREASPITTVRSSIQSAFVALDEDLSREAMPDSKGRINKMSVNIAASGSCALVAHIRKNNLHVASSGDSMAVLGVKLSNGFISRQLTRPHTSENVDEVERAFGDVRYKWPLELQKIVLEPLGMPAPQNLLTPPYLTSLPEVFYHQLTTNDHFLVLASDGLWEFLGPDTVVKLVHDHTLGYQTLNFFQPEQRQLLGNILEELEQRHSGDTKKPLDENCATHLIRNALGGVSGGLELQYARLEEMLMLPPGMARHYRDDITVIVIHFNQHFLESAIIDE